MNHRAAAKIDSYSVQFRTNMWDRAAKETIAAAAGYTSDNQRKVRKAQGLCKWCFYMQNDRVGGTECTAQPCGLCGVAQHFSNTCTDALCLQCAVQEQLCKRCGGDAEGRVRRIWKPAWPAPPKSPR